MVAPPPPPSWVIDLSTPPSQKLKSAAIADPPGFAATVGRDKKSVAAKSTRKSPTTEETDLLKVKKAWEVALAPVKSLPMTGFMMYMSGNSLQMFSIMMVFMAFKTPILGLFNTLSVFQRFESKGTSQQLWLIKAVYVWMQILAIGLGVWKVNQMGLLPTTRSDWLAWESAREPIETAIPAF